MKHINSKHKMSWTTTQSNKNTYQAYDFEAQCELEHDQMATKMPIKHMISKHNMSWTKTNSGKTTYLAYQA